MEEFLFLLVIVVIFSMYLSASSNSSITVRTAYNLFKWENSLISITNRTFGSSNFCFKAVWHGAWTGNRFETSRIMLCYWWKKHDCVTVLFMETSIFKHIRELSTQPGWDKMEQRGVRKFFLWKNRNNWKIYCLVFYDDYIRYLKGTYPKINR